MGKIIIQFELDQLYTNSRAIYYEHIQSIEMLRLDFEKGIKVILAEIILKKGSKIYCNYFCQSSKKSSFDSQAIQT